MAEFKVNFIPNPVQQAFIESRATADLFSSRMGEGKSAGLVWSIYYHTRHNPGASWALIRDTWENLRGTTLQELFKWFPPGVFGQFHETKKLWTWAEGVGTGTIQMIGMDDPNDATKLQSRPLGGIAIDEPAPAATSGGVSELIFDIGLSRLRQDNMKWYAFKLAENNPDESHWTYRRFVNPGTPGFRVHQPLEPENAKNLPNNYYAGLRQAWQHRPDLIRRFIDGRFGFQSIGIAVTPQWVDEIHLATGLAPVRGADLHLLWDFGLNPTCIITQVTPSGSWNVLYSFVGEGIGVTELCEATVGPLLKQRFRGFVWHHIGDPAGQTREQSSSNVTAVRMMRKILGGSWRPGPRDIESRVEPLRAVLGKLNRGRGLIQVDRDNAKEVWYSLRGGWHYHVARTGVISGDPAKDVHSHPGDAMSYGAAILYPMGQMQRAKSLVRIPSAGAFSSSGLGFERPKAKVPVGTRQSLGA